jgi:hypothetical protein
VLLPFVSLFLAPAPQSRAEGCPEGDLLPSLVAALGVLTPYKKLHFCHPSFLTISLSVANSESKAHRQSVHLLI